MKTSYSTRIKLITSTFIILGLSACSDSGESKDIPLSAVPPNIINIVQNTLPGIALDEAEKKVKNKKTTYKLEGKLINGKEYDIKIAEDGTILKIKLDD